MKDESIIKDVKTAITILKEQITEVISYSNDEYNSGYVFIFDLMKEIDEAFNDVVNNGSIKEVE